MDRLEALRTFVLVADQKSFAEAARRLRISPTAASRGVGELEESLGVTLLRRTTRSVDLTPEGSAYLERCRQILDDIEDADRSVRGEDAEPRGMLVVAAPVVFGRLHILPIINLLLRSHPALKARLTLNDRVVRLVEEGIDVAVRIADLAYSALHAVRVSQVRQVLVASPVYIEKRGVPTQLEELYQHDLIAFDGFAQNPEWRFKDSSRLAIRGEPRLLTNSVEATIDAAVDGVRIARLRSYQVLDHVRAGRLRYLLTEFEPVATPVNLVFQGGRRRTPSVSAFIAACQDHFREKTFD